MFIKKFLTKGNICGKMSVPLRRGLFCVLNIRKNDSRKGRRVLAAGVLTAPAEGDNYRTRSENNIGRCHNESKDHNGLQRMQTEKLRFQEEQEK